MPTHPAHYFIIIVNRFYIFHSFSADNESIYNQLESNIKMCTRLAS